MEGRESDRRLLIGTGILLLYLLIGAIIFVRLEYPLEKIERETYKEYRQQWTDRLIAVGIPGKKEGGGAEAESTVCVLPRVINPFQKSSRKRLETGPPSAFSPHRHRLSP